ncbi:MAG: sortase domain-containing protein [Solirubrobacterales bacterium]
MITAGVVVLLDVGVTLAWAEPLSALRAAIAQREAAEELDRLESEFARSTDRLDRTRLPALAARLERRVGTGHAIARIRIPVIDTDKVVAEGTDPASLRKGPGHYPDTGLPGERGTVAIAGHRTTYGAPFRHIDEIERARGRRRDAVRPVHLRVRALTDRRPEPGRRGARRRPRPTGANRLSPALQRL